MLVSRQLDLHEKTGSFILDVGFSEEFLISQEMDQAKILIKLRLTDLEEQEDFIDCFFQVFSHCIAT